MKMIATKKGEQNLAAADPWTLVHFSTGLAMGLTDVPLRWAIGTSLLYELIEQFFERRRWGKDLFRTAEPESVPNALVDVIVLVAGHHLGTRWNESADR